MRRGDSCRAAGCFRHTFICFQSKALVPEGCGQGPCAAGVCPASCSRRYGARMGQEVLSPWDIPRMFLQLPHGAGDAAGKRDGTDLVWQQPERVFYLPSLTLFF